MSAVIVDTHGCAYRLTAAAAVDRGGYASLFAQATTYHAQRLTPSVEDAQAAGEKCSPEPTTSPLASTVLVTHIPLTSSLQDAPSPLEAAALATVLRNLALRRRLRHPLLRTLIDAFFTDQQLRVAPVQSAAAENGGGECVAGARAPAAEGVRDSAHRVASTMTALVVMEEWCDGCSLADYADAVSSRRLTCSDAKLQRDATALVHPLASVLHYLHTYTPIVCRSLPLECVHLDVNQGTLRLRLPLTAVSLDTDSDEVDGDDVFAPAGCATVDGDVQDGARGLCAPEVCRLRDWGDSATTAALLLGGDGVSASADVWALGAVLLELCALNHCELAGPALHGERGRAVVLCRHIEKPEALLPHDVQATVAQLVGACLESVPRQRPSIAAVLKSAAFSTNRSFSSLEQSRAVISIAEAVVQLQSTDVATSGPQQGMAADAGLAMLTLPAMSWSTPDAFSDSLVPGGAPSGGVAGAALGAAASRGAADFSFSLAAMTQQTLQDVARLHARYREGGTSNAATSSEAVDAAGHAALRARVRRSRQLPRDIAGTAAIMGELTEHFAQLEQTDPESCVRLMELLVEGFAASATDVDAVAGGLVVADALLHASGTEVASPAAARDLASLDSSATFDDASLSSEVEAQATGFNVADTLRVMPSMPAQVFSSDRAANTTAVLYNSWLRKQKKHHLKMDGF